MTYTAKQLSHSFVVEDDLREILSLSRQFQQEYLEQARLFMCDSKTHSCFGHWLRANGHNQHSELLGWLEHKGISIIPEQQHRFDFKHHHQKKEAPTYWDQLVGEK